MLNLVQKGFEAMCETHRSFVNIVVARSKELLLLDNWTLRPAMFLSSTSHVFNQVQYTNIFLNNGKTFKNKKRV